jgi:hypothetical protein
MAAAIISLLNKGFEEAFGFIPVSIPARNEARLFTALRPNQYHDAAIEQAVAFQSNFTVVQAVIFLGQHRGIENTRTVGKINAVFCDVDSALVFVVYNHISNCTNNLMERQADLSPFADWRNLEQAKTNPTAHRAPVHIEKGNYISPFSLRPQVSAGTEGR